MDFAEKRARELEKKFSSSPFKKGVEERYLEIKKQKETQHDAKKVDYRLFESTYFSENLLDDGKAND